MIVRIFPWTRFRARCALAAVVLGASLSMTINATAQGQASKFTRECALKDIAAVTVIKDHGMAEDLPGDRLFDAWLTMLRARSATLASVLPAPIDPIVDPSVDAFLDPADA